MTDVQLHFTDFNFPPLKVPIFSQHEDSQADGMRLNSRPFLGFLLLQLVFYVLGEVEVVIPIGSTGTTSTVPKSLFGANLNWKDLGEPYPLDRRETCTVHMHYFRL